MIRLVLLSVPCVIVFAGFGVPFFVPGGIGLLVGAMAVVFGIILFWIVETKSRGLLRKDTPWNQFVKGGGDDLLGRRTNDSMRK